MKFASISLIIVASIATISFSEGLLRGGVAPDDARKLKKQKNPTKAKSKAGGGGGGNKGGGGKDLDNRVGVDDGKCCDGPAGPQPNTAGNRGGDSACPFDGTYKPTYRIAKKNEYTGGIPASHACACNDQCDDQDGSSMICCLRSHYFVGENNSPIQVCVDTTGITEAITSGCMVTASGSSTAPGPSGPSIIP